jgi:hypothetical protein
MFIVYEPYKRHRLKSGVHVFQLLGIAMRSDIPLALDILPSFWKSILDLPLDESDLHDADILTYNYIRRLSEVLYILLTADSIWKR